MSKRDKDARTVVRAQLAAEQRRRRAVLSAVIAVAVLVTAGLIGWGVLAAQRKDTAAALTAPSVAVDGGTGFAVGTGPVKVDVYEDFMCPVCGEFEKRSGAALTRLVADGKVTVVYHPIAILDDRSSTTYSTRAAAAAAAAAQGGRFAEFHAALFTRQPAEGSAGLDDATLIQIGRSVGLGDAFATSVQGGTYRAWATTVTETASGRGVTGTPTVLVAGKQVADALTDGAVSAAVAAAAT